MASYNIDTAKMIECGSSIVSKAKQAEEILDRLYTKLVNIDDLAWQGDAAKKFRGSIATKKMQYKRVVYALRDYGKLMKGAGNKLENIAKKM